MDGHNPKANSISVFSIFRNNFNSEGLQSMLVKIYSLIPITGFTFSLFRLVDREIAFRVLVSCCGIVEPGSWY